MQPDPLAALTSSHTYGQHFMDLGMWRPFVEQVCREHKLFCNDIRPGTAGTFPTFIVGEQWVVKFFGPLFNGQTCWQVERECAQRLQANPVLPIAKLITSGKLEKHPDWDYLIFEFIPGVSISEVYEQVTVDSKKSLGQRLGQSLQAMHRADGFEQTSLPQLNAVLMQNWHKDRDYHHWPEHLAQQRNKYLSIHSHHLQSHADSFIHADLTCDHMLGEVGNGIWKTHAIIDFGDAMLGNIFYELIALHLDLFDCSKLLLAAFLDAYELSPADREDFPHKAMTTALMHQFDVFGHLFKWKPQLQQVSSLDALADILWNLDTPGISE